MAFDFQTSPLGDRVASSLYDFNRMTFANVQIQRLYQLKMWPGARSPHASGLDSGDLTAQANFRRRWGYKAYVYSGSHLGTPIELSGIDFLYGPGYAPQSSGLPQRYNWDEGTSPTTPRTQWNFVHSITEDIGFTGTPNVADTLTLCSGTNTAPAGSLSIELSDEVPESTHVTIALNRLDARTWPTFAHDWTAEQFDEHISGGWVEGVGLDSATYTGAPVAAGFSMVPRPAIGVHDSGEASGPPSAPAVVSSVAYPWASVYLSGGSYYKRHGAIWSFWLYPLGSEYSLNPSTNGEYTLTAEQVRAKFSSAASASYWIGSAKIYWDPVFTMYEIGEVTVLSTGTLTNSSPVEVPVPTTTAFSESESGRLSCGHLNFMIVGESSAAWSARTGYGIAA